MKTNNEIEAIRVELTDFIEHSKGLKIRLEMHEYAKANYIPIHIGKYLKFMNDNICSFSINGAQESNHPYYLTLFTERSQHVMGDCVEECLDKAISYKHIRQTPQILTKEYSVKISSEKTSDKVYVDKIVEQRKKVLRKLINTLPDIYDNDKDRSVNNG